MHVLVVPLLARHVEVDYLVLVRIIDVESRLEQLHFVFVTYLDVQFARLLILDHGAKGL